MEVWKWYLTMPGEAQVLDVPRGTQLLTAQIQDRRLCVWGACDPAMPKVQRILDVVGTGWVLPDPASLRRHISTVQHVKAELVWHVFERWPVSQPIEMHVI